MCVYELELFLAVLCQDLWVLTPHTIDLHFVLHFGVLYYFDFLEKFVGPGQQGLHVATPVTEILDWQLIFI